MVEKREELMATGGTQANGKNVIIHEHVGRNPLSHCKAGGKAISANAFP